MKPARLFLMIALVALALFGVFWAVRAQEGPLFAPPPVLPIDDGDKKPAKKSPHSTQPSRDKAKADPTLIVPAEVHDVPRPIGPPMTESKPRVGFGTEEVPGVVPAQGTLPPLPALPTAPKVDAGPNLLPAPPAPLPIPMVDPAQLLIVDPIPKETPKTKTPLSVDVSMPPPVVMPQPKPALTLPNVSLPEAEPVETRRAFVRIKPDVSAAPQPGPTFDPRLTDTLRPVDQILMKPPPTAQSLSGLANLQTPSVTVEKRGPARLRSGAVETYQIVVRNLGPATAQQVRIEDELPANARIVNSEPMLAIQGNKAVWVLSAMPVNQEQIIRLILQASTDTEVTGRLSAHVAADSQNSITAPRPRSDMIPMTIQLVGPNHVAVGKSAAFEVHVTNPSNQPLTGIVLFGSLPEGLNTAQGREIEGEVDVTIASGETKTLKMPVNGVKPGRWTVSVKVTAHGNQQASATAVIDVAAETLHLFQPSATRMYMGRDGDLRIDVTNHTNKPLRNVTIADRLPDGVDFVDANERGLYQANSRIVYWVIDHLPAGKTQTLAVRVNGAKAGQHQNVVFAKADGVAEQQSAGIVLLEGSADLAMRIIERDNPLELGKETMYEIKVQNTGSLSASNVQLQVQFPAGLVPKSAQGKTRFTLDRQSIVFEPVAALESQSELVFRVTAQAQSVGDQRVQFRLASEQARAPIQREVSTRVYSDRNP